MKSKITRDFRKRFEKMSQSVQEQVKQTYMLWQTDPYHGSFQFKRVSHSQPIYSIRIGIGYRALGLREGDVIYWYWIGSHAEYNELLHRL
ncbi:MAG: hypothetical protein C4527_16055 [Candidatus Omnitrophota bacterium]|nr:MAG: hypothetical protein C4527_16055 [Candidatus Omnitrophota bacterium]